jgi:hypothetical protein
MRGEDNHEERLFSYVRLETRIPTDHPLRAIRELVDAALKDLSRSFDRLYAREGRPSIPPERLLRALLLQAFYTVRSERQLMEQLDYNLLFRWFVGLSADDSVWCDRILQKPGSAARRRYRGKVFHKRSQPAAGEQAAVERALLGRRDLDRGLGQHEELCTEG